MTVVLARRYEQLEGKRFGALSYARPSDQRGDGNRVYAVFLCACGTEIHLPVSRVTSGGRAHCGCQANRTPNLQHGMRGSKEYSSWISMKRRCLCADNKDFPRWGGKGVTIFSEWVEDFEAFYEHIGPRPINTTLDRIDNTKGYEPGNVRWATAVEQQRNRTKSYVWHIKGLTFESCLEAAEHFGVSEHTVWRWVNGQQDRRRDRWTPPREDCHVVARY